MTQEQDYMLTLITAALKDKTPCPRRNIDWKLLFETVAFSCVSSTVWHAIEKIHIDSLTTPEVLSEFRTAADFDVMLEVMQHFDAEHLFTEFENQGINYCPLKGYVLKNYYPHPSMRSMSDIDFLVSGEQFDKAAEIIKKMGFKFTKKDPTHSTYYKEPYTYIELHKNLLSSRSKYSNYYNDVWKKLKPIEGTHRYEMSLEDTYLYILLHIDKHISHAGTGVRDIMDIFVFLQKFRDELNRGYIEKELKNLGLITFEKNLVLLAFNWFEVQPDVFPPKHLSEYILECGIHGTEEQMLLQYSFNKSNFQKKEEPLSLSKAFEERGIMAIPYILLFPFVKSIRHKKLNKFKKEARKAAEYEKLKKQKIALDTLYGL